MGSRGILSVLLVVILAIALAMPSFGAPSKTKKSKTRARTTVEVYPAMEEEEIAPLAIASEVSEIRLPPAPKTQVTPTEFYNVPQKQAELIAGRLRIVEAILIESGRAYDYRSHTSRELKNILAAIRSQKPTANTLLAE